MRKVVAVITMLLMLGAVNAFGKTLQLSTSAEFGVELGTVWVYDMEQEASGFREEIDLDLEWFAFGFSGHDTEVPEGEDTYGQFHGAGAEWRVTLYRTDGARAYWRGTAPENVFDRMSLNTENIWGQITFPGGWYMIVGAYNMITYRTNQYAWFMYYERNDADLAVMRSRLQVSYLSSQWNHGLGSMYSQGGYRLSSAGITLGKGGEKYDMHLSIAGDLRTGDTYNTDNCYDFKLGFNWMGNEKLKLQAFAVAGINYEDMPFGASVYAAYRKALNDTYTLEPFIGVDMARKYEDTGATSAAAQYGRDRGVYMDGIDDSAMEIEVAGGLTIEWPGAGGWGGDEPLFTDQNTGDNGGQRLPGVTASFSYLKPAPENADGQINMAVSSWEETAGGLIPNLGWSAIVEIANLNEANDAGREVAWGFYTKYEAENKIVPFVKYRRAGSLEAGTPTELQVGVDYKGIHKTKFRVRYRTNSLSEDDDYGIVKDKGRVEVAAYVYL